MMEKVAGWTLAHMQAPEGYFYYRQQKDGKISTIPYIRWGQAWMLWALAKMLEKYSERGHTYHLPNYK
jgi:hypothetical protein